MEKINKKDYFMESVILDKSFYQDAMNWAINKIESIIPEFLDGYPAPASVNNIYPKLANNEWTSSFYNGMLWYAYLNSKKKVFKNTAEKTLADYKNRLDQRIETATHDLGFLYILSAKAEYMITGNTEARDVALQAADLLMERYCEKAGILQAWGDMNNPQESGRMIIDCLMNIPILFWVADVTGNGKYREAATNHLNNSVKYLIREDDTTFHTYFFDVKTGLPCFGKTAQGFSDESCWARGQAWGIYGLSLNYHYTNDYNLLKKAKALANHFINSLPEDDVCYWDLIFTKGNEERDSSAAAIAVCGLLDLAQNLSVLDEDRKVYEAVVLKILESLARNYTTVGLDSNGLLKHAVYGKPFNRGVDECNIWGDYFYIEALDRVLNNRKVFW